ncbi:MAG TPA: hypothetical protein VJA21_09500 [Verrucomicrobiae bacterium]
MSTSPVPPSSSNPIAARQWRVARRLLLAVAAAATLVAVFFAEENWRGKRAWEKCRRELEAKGEAIDWGAYIPAPVPDDQNFYKAPKMRDWFVKENFAIGETGSPNTPRLFAAAPRKDTNVLLAEVAVIAPNAPRDSQPAGAMLRFDEPAGRQQAARLLGDAVGPGVMSARACVLLARPLDQIKPLRLVVEARQMPTLKELTDFFPANPLTNSVHASSGARYLQIDPAGKHTFHVSLKKPVYGAADYLAWTEPMAPDFDLVRRALERPYARIDCDYQVPFAIGIPNFIMIRNVAQTLSEQTQCHLLLGQPETALRELTLVHDLCQILQAKPSGKPLTLVGAMIDVAVTGLYTGIVEDGLRLHAWREPQLQALERQLKDIDLLALVVEAFREERAATCRTFEITKRSELVKVFNFTFISKLALRLMPHGWFYQNMVAGASIEQELLGNLDLTNRLIRPRQISELIRKVSDASERRSPYRFLVAISMPNFAKALQTAVRNQTLVDQARLACALERYRLTQGHYPDALAALTPGFIEKPPHDLVGGQSLRYRLTDDGGYLLYSIGWNEKDDGGVAGKSSEEGDWFFER